MMYQWEVNGNIAQVDISVDSPVALVQIDGERKEVPQSVLTEVVWQRGKRRLMDFCYHLYWLIGADQKAADLRESICSLNNAVELPNEKLIPNTLEERKIDSTQAKNGQVEQLELF